MTDIQTNPRTHADEAWKHVLNVYFQSFMCFFFPDLAKKIDWAAGYEMLDQELLKIASDSVISARRVDKLIKVKSLDGQHCLVLLHVEVQNTKDKHFEPRLFQYFYRLCDLYDLPVLTLAILADDRVNWRPDHYTKEVWGHPVCHFQFLISKLLDYKGQEDQLTEMDNPFGTVVAAHLAGLKTRSKPEERYTSKLALTRQLYDKGLGREAIINLYTFIDGILTLPESLANRYNDSIEAIEQERNMAYVTSIEQRGIQQGLQQGLLQSASSLAKYLLNTENFSPEKVKKAVKEATGLEIADKDLAELRTQKPNQH